MSEVEALHNEKIELRIIATDLLEALDGLLADITEYQTINNLGGENNHWQVKARYAIANAKDIL